VIIIAVRIKNAISVIICRELTGDFTLFFPSPALSDTAAGYYSLPDWHHHCLIKRFLEQHCILNLPLDDIIHLLPFG